MSKQMFINLPVADFRKSLAFFEALGFAPHPQFSGDEGGCIVINDSVCMMLCPHDKFREFTPKAICDTVYATSGYAASVSNLAAISLASDNVFGNDSAAQQMAVVTGSVATGYAASLTVGV